MESFDHANEIVVKMCDKNVSIETFTHLIQTLIKMRLLKMHSQIALTRFLIYFNS